MFDAQNLMNMLNQSGGNGNNLSGMLNMFQNSNNGNFNPMQMLTKMQGGNGGMGNMMQGGNGGMGDIMPMLSQMMNGQSSNSKPTPCNHPNKCDTSPPFDCQDGYKRKKENHCNCSSRKESSGNDCLHPKTYCEPSKCVKEKEQNNAKHCNAEWYGHNSPRPNCNDNCFNLSNNCNDYNNNFNNQNNSNCNCDTCNDSNNNYNSNQNNCCNSNQNFGYNNSNNFNNFSTKNQSESDVNLQLYNLIKMRDNYN